MQRKKSITIFDYQKLKPYIPFIVLSVLFVSGVLAGSLLVRSNDMLSVFAGEKLSEMISDSNARSILILIRRSLFSILPLYLIVFAFGMSVVGVAAAPVVIVYHGFIYGCLSGFLYSGYGLEGIVVSALILLPSFVVSAFGLLLISKEAISFSYLLADVCIKSNKPVNVYSDFRKYCINSSLTFVVAAVSVMFDVGMTFLFADYFNL